MRAPGKLDPVRGVVYVREADYPLICEELSQLVRH